jgi:hypothetical protein
MRIWDVNPGYLNRQSLLGEHREIHGLFSVIYHNKKGYSHHPETLRWIGKLPALKQRHDLLVSEMTLRGFRHYSPMPDCPGQEVQKIYVDFPYRQFEILKEKYQAREKGRIPLPIDCRQLWAQHKYSVMARDPDYYKKIGPLVSIENNDELFQRLSREFVELLRLPPPRGRLINAIHHIWGYVSAFTSLPEPQSDLNEWLNTIRELTIKHNVTYLAHSTALNDLILYV